MGKKHRCQCCALKSGLLEDGLHLLGRLQPGSVCATIKFQYAHLRSLKPKACQHGAMAMMKIMTGLMKMGGPYIHPHWRQLCYWELQYDYVPYKKMEDMKQEVEEWLCDRNSLGGPLGEDQYMDELYVATREFMQEQWHVPPKLVGVEDWVNNGRWMEGKSGDGSTTVIDIDGKPVRSRRMKTVEGITTSDKQVAVELRTPYREMMQVMQKAESGKIRPVVKTGNRVNRKMNYLSHVLEEGFKGSLSSTLFAGSIGNETIDYDIIAAVRDNSTWKVPLDQGNFDKRQTRVSVAVVMKAVWDHILP